MLSEAHSFAADIEYIKKNTINYNSIEYMKGAFIFQGLGNIIINIG